MKHLFLALAASTLLVGCAFAPREPVAGAATAPATVITVGETRLATARMLEQQFPLAIYFDDGLYWLNNRDDGWISSESMEEARRNRDELYLEWAEELIRHRPAPRRVVVDSP